MIYKVLKTFMDKEDNNTLYEVGDEFPKGNSKPTKKRIEELSQEHPRYKVVFIEEVAENKSSKGKSKQTSNKE